MEDLIRFGGDHSQMKSGVEKRATLWVTAVSLTTLNVLFWVAFH